MTASIVFDMHYNNVEINGEYRVGPALLGVAYDYMKGSSISSARGKESLLLCLRGMDATVDH